jgi:hypothetical protein
MSLHARLTKLEGGHGDACPVCGIDPTLPVRLRVVWQDEATDEAADPTPCPRCGHRKTAVLHWAGEAPA